VLKFVATECGSQNDGEAIICGASNTANTLEPHSLIFVRSRERLDDGGPYFELDDQSRGFHNIVREVRLIGRELSIQLKAQRGRSVGHGQIIVQLDCTARQIASLKRGIAVVFRDEPERASLG
jgi:hypothetical protein